MIHAQGEIRLHREFNLVMKNIWLHREFNPATKNKRQMNAEISDYIGF